MTGIRSGRLVRAAGLVALLAGLATGPAGAAPLLEVLGRDNRIVLLGSIHFLRPSDSALPPPVVAALGDADVIYLELDLDDLDPVATAGAMAALARDPRGRDLPALLGPAAWEEARRSASALGVDLGNFAAFEPWYAALLVSQLRLVQLGFDPARGIESQVVQAAREDGKEIRGLETLAEQLGALDGLSPAAQRTFLLETLGEAADAEAQVDQLLAAWRSGDREALAGHLLAGLANQAEAYERVVVDRNRRFARVIAGLTGDDRDYLVVMGALHLVGPDSVPELLEDRGLKVLDINAGQVPR